MPFSWLARFDTIFHKLHIPKRLWRPICDEYDRRLCDSYYWAQQYVNENSTSASVNAISVKWIRKRHDER